MDGVGRRHGRLPKGGATRRRREHDDLPLIEPQSHVKPICRAVSTVVVVSGRRGFIKMKGVKACAAPVANHGPERDSA